mmetsp:Transcript_158139/g.384046  ORF Transcript_158139/g.384046 Transcript_158139/m.384046 type:complete len:106 (-) Transcript_158139:35-352(-)
MAASATPALEILSFAVDRVGCVISWSAKAAEVLGYASEEVTGRPIQKYLVASSCRDDDTKDEHVDRFVEKLEAARASSSELTLWLTAQDGKVVCSLFAVKQSGRY